MKVPRWRWVMRRRFISWGLALGLGLPGGLASISSARAETPEAAGSAAKEAGEAAKQAGEAAQQAGDAAKSAGKAAEEAGDEAGTATKRTTETTTERASGTMQRTSGKTSSAKSRDARIEEAVESRLEKGDMDDGIQVQTKNGVVTLTGTVDSEAMRTRIVDAASDTKGVKDVNDHIKVETVEQGDSPDRR
jgi:osmotically-inducible protein OsmY